MEVFGIVLLFVVLVAFVSWRLDRRSGRRSPRRLYASGGGDGVVDSGWSDSRGDGCDSSSSDGGGSDGGGCGGE